VSIEFQGLVQDALLRGISESIHLECTLPRLSRGGYSSSTFWMPPSWSSNSPCGALVSGNAGTQQKTCTLL